MRRRRKRAGLELGLVAALLALYWVMAVSSVREKSTTFDEVAHITSGYAVWAFDDYRLTPKTGAFTQRFMTLPLLSMRLNFPALYGEGKTRSRLLSLADQFFHSVGNDPGELLFPCRAMVAFLGMVLGGVVYLWSRSLFGVSGGIISLLLYVFSPTFLAHGRLATADLNATLFFLLATGSFWRALHRVDLPSLGMSSAALGGLLLSKVSGLVFLLVALLLTALRLLSGPPVTLGVLSRWAGRMGPRGKGGRIAVAGWKSRLVVTVLSLTAQALAVALLIWGVYGFRYSAAPSAELALEQFNLSWEEVLVGSSGIGRAVSFAKEHRLLPEAYLFGLAGVVSQARERPAFLNGEFRMTGWRHFFPYAFLVKTPLPFLILLCTAFPALVSTWRRKAAEHDKPARHAARAAVYRTAPLWMFFLLYWVVLISSNLNIGHRFTMPVYPPLFILAGASARWFRGRLRWPAVAVTLLLLLHAGASLGIRPHYLAYFNQLAGGPAKGYLHLVDSSLDWGQDLPGLKKWLEANRRGEEPVYLSYFGAGDPGTYGIDAYRLPGFLDRERKIEFGSYGAGIYCISATMLATTYTRYPLPWTEEDEEELRFVKSEIARLLGEGPAPGAGGDGDDAVKQRQSLVHDYDQLRFARFCRFLRQREPDDTIGYSILIYRVTNEEVGEALRGV